jgi:hypothetical protein
MSSTKTRTFFLSIGEDIIHDCLKCRWCNGQSERHDSEFPITIVSMEGGSVLIGWLQPYLMIYRAQIQLSKPLDTKFLYNGKRVLVFLIILFKCL